MAERQVLYRNTRSMSAPFYPPAPEPVVERKARVWRPIEETHVNYAEYPASLDASPGPLAALSQCQALLRPSSNFAKATECELMELGRSDEPVWTSMDDAGLNNYLDETGRRLKESASQPQGKVSSATPILRIIFAYLTDARRGKERTSFGCQSSLQQGTAIKLLETFQINPHFVQFLLGKPDHLAPFDVHDCPPVGGWQHEFICQYPRWFVHTKQEPCSVYFRHDTASLESTYLVVSDREDELIQRAKARLRDLLLSHTRNSAGLPANLDPFYLSAILCRESLADSEIVTREVRLSLYDVLDVVDMYADKPFDRTSLRKSTRDLHKISQDCERLLSNCEMLKMVISSTRGAHAKVKLAKADVGQNSLTADIVDALSYLAEAVDQQTRWLQGYRRRKDTGMNLVYNLVIQQDSETNTSIAIATKDDSAVMKVIALLTMCFLPLTAVTSFFGMSFFMTSSEGEWVAAHNWWIIWTVALPVTLVTIGVYYLWWQSGNLKKRFWQIWQASSSVIE